MKILPYQGTIRSTLSKARAAAKAGRPRKKKPFHFKPKVIFDTGSDPPVVVNDIFEGATGILEILTMSDEPSMGAASPLSDEKLLDLFGTTKPSREAAEKSFRLANERHPGQAVYVFLFDGDAHREIMFIGCSSTSCVFSVVVPFVADTGLALEKARALVKGTPNPDGNDLDGTATALDILFICDEPEVGGACPLKEQKLLEFFGTTEPTRQMAEAKSELYDEVGRGEGRYIVLYEGDAPKDVVFYGYSHD